MSLIKCKECGRDLSSLAKACPNCGAPRSHGRPIFIGLMQVLVGLIGLSVVLSFALKRGSDELPSKETAALSVQAAPHKPLPRPSRTIRAPLEIGEFVRPFKTANGKSLEKLVKQYGLSIAYIDIAPIEMFAPSGRHSSDEDGDWIASIVIDGIPNRKMPCDLNRWQGGNGMTRSVSEVPLRDGKFFVSEDIGDLLFWAATGRCVS